MRATAEIRRNSLLIADTDPEENLEARRNDAKRERLSRRFVASASLLCG